MADNKKQDREKAIAFKFLQLHSEFGTLNLQYLRPGDPNRKEPDIICFDNYSIEIVSTYDNDSQAKNYWEDMNGINNPYQKRDLLLQPEDKLTNTIDTKLKKLEAGLYAGVDQSKILLLCYSESRLFNHQKALDLQAEYQPFGPDHFYEKYFCEIWLMWWNGGDSYGVLRLE
ncbi:MAG: hypothetical protein WAX66_03500 [Patescibacteria group bacterium]